MPMILWHCLPIFQVTFLCSLLLFWICLYHGIRVNERRFIPFYLPKFIIVGRFRYPISYLAYCLQFPLFSSINSFSLPSLPPSISHHFCFILIFHPFNRDPLPFLPFFIPSSFYSSIHPSFLSFPCIFSFHRHPLSSSPATFVDPFPRFRPSLSQSSGLLWLAAFTLSTWQVSNSLRDPTYSTAVDSGNFLGFKTFFFVVGQLKSLPVMLQFRF